MAWLPTPPLPRRRPAVPSPAEQPDILGGITGGLRRNSNALIGLGTNLMSAPTWSQGLAAAGQGWAAGNQTDLQRQQMAQAEAEKKAAQEADLKRTNATVAWLEQKHPDLAQAVQAGLPVSDAFSEAFKRDQSTTAPGGYAGTSMDAQNWNILLKAANDPSQRATPEYAAAYAQLTEPKVTYQMTPDGLMPVMQQPNIPQWVLPPPGMPAPASQPAAGGLPAAPGAAAPTGAPAPSVGGSGTVTTAPVIPGTQKPKTEAELRIGMITNIIANEVPGVAQNFGALADTTQQVIGLGGDATNAFQSPQYRQALNGVTATVANVLYALSGASSNPGEVRKQVDVLTPKIGDDPGTVQQKMKRFFTYVQSVATASGDKNLINAVNQIVQRAQAGPAGPPMPAGMPSPAQQPAGGGNTTSTGVTWSF